jgi:hypothetical protein
MMQFWKEYSFEVMKRGERGGGGQLAIAPVAGAVQRPWCGHEANNWSEVDYIDRGRRGKA